MKIDTRLTKTHVATFAAEDITSVAVAAVKANLGITDDSSVVSAEGKVAADGTVTVEIVEAVPAETAQAIGADPTRVVPTADTPIDAQSDAGAAALAPVI